MNAGVAHPLQGTLKVRDPLPSTRLFARLGPVHPARHALGLLATPCSGMTGASGVSRPARCVTSGQRPGLDLKYRVSLPGSPAHARQ